MDLFFVFKIVGNIVHMKGHSIHAHETNISMPANQLTFLQPIFLYI